MGRRVPSEEDSTKIVNYEEPPFQRCRREICLLSSFSSPGLGSMMIVYFTFADGKQLSRILYTHDIHYGFMDIHSITNRITSISSQIYEDLPLSHHLEHG
ncbi:Protein of unknown function [Gryllus bimaculatus]|nr:Protein of unknown function [Gryllus bimaculatus]